jgi:phosphatidylglycerophosphatase A
MTILRPDLKFLFAPGAPDFRLRQRARTEGTRQIGTLLGQPLFTTGRHRRARPAGLITLLVADHGGMVWDEIVAFALVLLFTPAGWLWIALAFALFRLFDILKPWPIRLADTRLKNGFGVMFDDLLAAGYAIAALKGLQWLV